MKAPSGAVAKLNVAAFEQKLAKLRAQKANGTYSTGLCATGVRELLDILMPRKVGFSADGVRWNTTVLNRWAPPCYSQVSDSKTTYQNFDVKSMPHRPGGGGNGAGHVEIFYEGRWYSDFAQNGSNASNTNRYMGEKAKLFRMNDGTCKNTASHRNADFFSTLYAIYSFAIPAVFADDEKGSTYKRPAPSQKILASYQDKKTLWEITETNDERREGVYQLYKTFNSTRTLIAENDLTGFHLLEEVKNQKNIPTKILARIYLDNWVKKVGKDVAQKAILAIPEMAIIQKDAYVEAGFKLPEKYVISVLDNK